MKFILGSMVLAFAFLACYFQHTAAQASKLYEIKISQLRSEIESLERGREHVEPDFARLRSNVLKLPESELTHSEMEAADSLDKWVQRAAILKGWAARLPEKCIPEMGLLNDEDWMKAVGDLNIATEWDARVGLNNARQIAKSRFAGIISAALKSYIGQHQGEVPQDLASLAPYMNVSIDALSALSRYKMLVAGSVVGLGRTAPVIRESVYADDFLDSTMTIQFGGQKGFNGTSYVGKVLNAAASKFLVEHPGESPVSYAQLEPYIDRKLDEVTAQKYLDYLNELGQANQSGKK